MDDDQADIMLSATPESGIENRHRVDPVYRERFKVLYDAKQLGCQGPLTREQYLATPHALLSLDGALESGLDRTLAESGWKRDVQVAVTHFPTIPHILKSSAMLANVPGTAAGWFARQHNLEVHKPPVDFPSFEVALLSHVRATNDPAIDWFRELIIDEVSYLTLLF